jgi:hypothetical protein
MKGIAYSSFILMDNADFAAQRAYSPLEPITRTEEITLDRIDWPGGYLNVMLNQEL